MIRVVAQDVLLYVAYSYVVIFPPMLIILQPKAAKTNKNDIFNGTISNHSESPSNRSPIKKAHARRTVFVMRINIKSL